MSDTYLSPIAGAEQPEEPKPAEPLDWLSSFASGFKLENDVYNALEYFNGAGYATDLNFDSVAATKEAGLWDYRDYLAPSRSRGEFDYKVQKLQKEQALRMDYMRSGKAGLFGAIAGGALSPTMFIPLIGPEVKTGDSVMKAFRSAVLYGTIGGVLQEIPLQLNQEDRSLEESTMSVLGQAIISGILGSLAHGLSARELKKMSDDMAIPPNGKAIPKLGSEAHTETRVTFDAPEVPKEHTRVFELPVKEGESPKFTTRVEDVIAAGVEKGRYIDLPTEEVPVFLKSVEEVQAKPGEVIDLPPQLRAAMQEGKVVKEIVGVPAKPEDIDKWETDAGLGSSAGAKEVFEPKGGTLKTALTKPFDPIFDRVALTSRMINQPGVEDKWQSVRSGAWQLDNGGVMGEINLRGEATAPGGTIKDRADTHYGKFFEAWDKYIKAYHNYVFDGKPPKFAGIQAALRAKGLGKLTRSEFNREVGFALLDDSAPVSTPEVREAANAVRKFLLDPLFKAGKEAGVFKHADKELIGDKSYFARMIDSAKAALYQIRLQNDLAAHYHQILLNDFDKAFQRELARGKAADQAIADMQLPGDVAQALRQELLDKLEKAEESRWKDDLLLEEVIRDKQKALKERLRQRRELKKRPEIDTRSVADRQNGVMSKKEALDKEIEALRKDIKQSMTEYSPEEVAFREMKKSTRTRLRALNRNAEILAEKRSIKYEQAYDLEESAIDTLARMSGRLQRLKEESAKLSDEEFLPKVRKLRDQFAAEGKKFDATEEKLLALQEDLANTDKGLQLELKQEVRADKMTKLAEKLHEAENLDRAGWQELIADLRQSTLQRINDLNKRRALRQEQLFEEIKALDPAKVKARIDEVAGKSKARREAFLDRWREEKGLTNARGVFHGEAPEFMDHAMSLAEETAARMANTVDKLPYNDLIAGPRGSEISRMLTIPTEKIAYVMEMDAEKMMRAYVHSMAPDIELARAFGDVRATRLFEEMKAERARKLEALRTAVDKDGKKLSEAEIEKRSMQIHEQHTAFARMVEAQISRLRRTRGLPDNPRDFAYRAGVVVRNLNVLRYMGGTLISSIPDVARLIMKHGFTRVYRDLFIPLIANFKELKLTAREALLAGEALDVILHSRRDALFDVMTAPSHLSAFERNLQWATDKIGIVAGFDYWNQGLKSAAGVLDVAHLMDSMKTLMEGGTKKEIDAATVYLAKFNLEGHHVERIWKQVVQQPGGGDKVRGLWWPNTEGWVDEEAKTLFRQALSNNIKSTIITPGLERPMIFDANLGFRLMFQFKTFAFSSLTRNVQAGLQQGDMAVLNGALFSLALGALSYYTWAVATGGRALDEANEFDPAKYADEAIARSGLLAVGQDAWDIAQRLPWVRDYSTLSGKQVAQRQGVNLIELLAGPSFDAAQRAGNVILNLDKPTATTVHSARTLLPFQNLFFIRQALDHVEQWLVDTAQLPARRD